jgi:hypothetical protein
MNDEGDVVIGTQALLIGGATLADGRNENFVGTIDEVYIFDHALTVKEVCRMLCVSKIF